MPARWGGEEFVVLLPLTALAQAMLVANRLRSAIGATATPTCAGPLPVTCSCGVAQRRREGLRAQRLRRRAGLAAHLLMGYGDTARARRVGSS